MIRRQTLPAYQWGKSLRAAGALLVALLLWCSLALAHDSTVDRIHRQLAPLTQELEQLETRVQRVDLSRADLEGLRKQIEAIRATSLRLLDELQQPLLAASQSLEQLGTAPENGAEEAQDIAEQRQRLTERRDQIRAVLTQLELLRVSSQQLAEQASSIQRNRFFQRVFVSGRSVLDPRLWLDGWYAVDPLLKRFLTVVTNWWGQVQASWSPLTALLMIGQLAVGFIGGFAAYRILNWLIRPRQDKPAPTDLERLWDIFARVIIAIVALLFPIILAHMALLDTVDASQQVGRIYWAFATLILVIMIPRTLMRGVLAPNRPAWRIVNLGDDLALRMSGLLGLMIVVFALDSLLRRLSAVLFVPVQFTVAQGALVSILMAVLLVLILLATRQGEDDAEAGTAPVAEARSSSGYLGWIAQLPLFFWGMAVAIIVSLVLGLIALAHYLSQQLVILSFLVVTLMLIRNMADQLVSNGLQANRLVGRFLRRTLSLSNRSVDRLGVAIATSVDFGLLFIGVPLVVLQTAVTWVDITSWLNTAFFGFRIGGITISLYTVVAVIAAFGFGFLLTKLFTRWLDARVISRTQLNPGLRDSINAVATYAGLILSGLFALSYAGLNFSNLAIIAGALGVGIGFGLQSIVNNFVSGLIILAERPIKVGDLIKVSGGQGVVKKINVRSTEIETGDKSTVIVPNSSLISESVQNWTHADTMGRVLVPVRADPEANPEKVLHILVNAAQSHERVLAFPSPSALFTNFGVAANEFELYCYVADVTTIGRVASDIRIAILHTFEEEGIGMPFNGQEIKLARPMAVKASESDDQAKAGETQ